MKPSSRATYSSIRRQHLVFALRSLTRRQQTALVLVAAILGPASVGVMQGVASALDVFVLRETSPWWRAGAWLAWFLVTGLIVLALREAVFMLASRPFLRMLPISRGMHLACDMRSIAIAYSFLWLPIAYFVWATWSSSRALAWKLDATITLAVGLAIAGALQALALQGKAAPMLLALFSAAALCVAPSIAWPGSWLVLLAAIALSGFALASGYDHAARSRVALAIALPLASRMAAVSGLAIPVAWRDLRHAIGLRAAFVATVMAAGAWLARDGAFCQRRTGLMLVEAALMVLAIHRVPALIDERLRESLPWLFRLASARRRALAASAVMMAASFAGAFACASWLWVEECGPLDRVAIATMFGTALCGLAAAALRWKEASSWVAIVTVLVIAFAAGEML